MLNFGKVMKKSSQSWNPIRGCFLVYLSFQQFCSKSTSFRQDPVCHFSLLVSRLCLTFWNHTAHLFCYLWLWFYALLTFFHPLVKNLILWHSGKKTFTVSLKNSFSHLPSTRSTEVLTCLFIFVYSLVVYSKRDLSLEFDSDTDAVQAQWYLVPKPQQTIHLLLSPLSLKI